MEKRLQGIIDLMTWLKDNWATVLWIVGGIWASVKSVFAAYKWYNSKATPVRAWIKKMGNAADLITGIAGRQSNMWELSDIAMFETDAEGYCIRVNQALCNLYGATKEQMIGTGWLQFIIESEDEKEFWLQAMLHDNEVDREYTVNVGKRKDNPKKCRYNAIINRDPQGQVINVMGKVYELV